PQLRDFSSIIQTCSGNIQRISQASCRDVEPGWGYGRGHIWGCLGLSTLGAGPPPQLKLEFLFWSSAPTVLGPKQPT
ncbi:hypothetical protein P7K49_015795, partial [Saguinus oedipus]